MDTIRIDVTGERQVGLRFESFPDALYYDLRAEVNALSQEVFSRVQAATPDRTGKLLSQERLRLIADKNRITGYIDIESKDQQDHGKAAALEYGSRGTQAKVSSHSMLLDHYWSLKLSAPERVMVDAYSRTPTVIERKFERGPLDEMRPEIISRLNAVVERRVAETNA